MDQLFNAFISQSLTGSAPLRYALSANSEHNQFLCETDLWLANDLKCNSGKQLPCITGWRMAIACLHQLWAEFRDNFCYKLLLTYRLNPECVENVFSVIRGQGDQRDNPDPQQFWVAFRQVMVDTVKNHSQVTFNL